MALDTDIAITGGGLNGPALALALAQDGFRVTIIDKLAAHTRADAGFDGRCYALAAASCRLLTGIGLWPKLGPHAQPIEEVKVCDGRAGEGPSGYWLHLQRGSLDEGPMGHMIEDRHLRPALLAAVTHHPAITQLSEQTVTGQEVLPGSARLTLASGETLTASLIVGADGRQSGTAERAGITRSNKDYGQTAVTCAVAHTLPHNAIAHQFFMPPGPLAILPLTGNRSSVVWTETHARAAEIMQLDDSGFLTALRPAFGDFLGALSLTGQRFAYPLTLTLAKSFTAPRVALTGDAAHGMHPIAGQGLNAGLRDVAALADVLGAARRRGEDIGAPGPLARYRSWRQFDTASLAMATDGFNGLFSNDNVVLRGIRNLGLGAGSSLPAISRRLAREAAGLTGDLPKLMQA
ncbi:MAG: UbiH/UbiF/VisC/COQ6 family ubiquinone biosynthesis hydroxylase [Rhodobacteraceae bacterium]|nr:UbiH/UbiF/VisC/COQ6 family ubiquinone biosynthesis hydroxylase [Paracoccaceae bacterium]